MKIRQMGQTLFVDDSQKHTHIHAPADMIIP